MRRKLLSIVLSLAMCISMLPMAGAEAYADEQGSEPQSYVYYTLDGTTAVKHSDGVCAEYSEINGEDNIDILEADHWYVVKGNVGSGALWAKGNANIILTDGSSLTVSGGIDVSQGNSLNIYAQSAGTGKLITSGTGLWEAGIGTNRYDAHTGDITIHGGVIKANGHTNAAGIGGGYEKGGGHIVIYDGTIEANGGADAPGIGSGKDLKEEAGTLDVYGGYITANGSSYGAGIGGGNGSAGMTVNVYGGEVTAGTSGEDNAGIGGGFQGKGGDVTINGGTVTAIGGSKSAGIGGGKSGDGGSVTINGGTVIASGYRSIGRGDGLSHDNGTFTLADGVKFGAGDNAENLSVMGDNSNAQSAFDLKYFVTPYVHEHVFNKEIKDERFLKSEGTCEIPAVYFKSCFCGEASETETFNDGTMPEHAFPEEWEPEDGNNYYHKRVCTRCKTAVDYDTHWIIGDTCIICGYELKYNVVLNKSKFTYSGKSNRPNVTVELLGETVPAEEYDVIYPTSTVNVGTYEVKVVLKDSGEEIGSATYQVVKATPNLKVTTVTKKYKRSTIRKYSKTAKQISVSGAKGAVTYKKISGYKNLRVNSKTGKITCIKHKCGKATKSHSIKVKVTCAGSSNYNKASKTVTVTVKMVK